MKCACLRRSRISNVQFNDLYGLVVARLKSHQFPSAVTFQCKQDDDEYKEKRVSKQQFKRQRAAPLTAFRVCSNVFVTRRDNECFCPFNTLFSLLSEKKTGSHHLGLRPLIACRPAIIYNYTTIMILIIQSAATVTEPPSKRFLFFISCFLPPSTWRQQTYPRRFFIVRRSCALFNLCRGGQEWSVE